MDDEPSSSRLPLGGWCRLRCTPGTACERASSAVAPDPSTRLRRRIRSPIVCSANGNGRSPNRRDNALWLAVGQFSTGRSLAGQCLAGPSTAEGRSARRPARRHC